MNKADRHHQIIRLVEQSKAENILTTREIAERLGVSEMTIRRDLRDLSVEGLIQRQHGGAVAVRPSVQPPRREIGIVLVSMTGKYRDPFFNTILEGADRKLKELNYRLSYINTQEEIHTAAQVRELLKANPVDGLILVGYLSLESIEYLKQNLRAIVKTTDSIGPDVDTVMFDGRLGMHQMVNHLVSLGRRRLAFLSGNFDTRYDGFLDGVAEHHLPSDAELMVSLPFGLDGWTPEMGYEGAQRVMQLPHPPDAIVCASDRMAMGAIQWLHKHHYRVPDDVAVTGFDNIRESAFTSPALTTVHVHKELIGELSAERVVKRIENPNEIPLFIQTPTYLVIRQSCGGQK